MGFPRCPLLARGCPVPCKQRSEALGKQLELRTAHVGVASPFGPSELPFAGNTQTIRVGIALCCWPGFFLVPLFLILLL